MMFLLFTITITCYAPHVIIVIYSTAFQQHLNAQGSNGPVPPNAQSTPAPPPTPTNNTEEKRHRPEKLS